MAWVDKLRGQGKSAMAQAYAEAKSEGTFWKEKVVALKKFGFPATTDRERMTGWNCTKFEHPSGKNEHIRVYVATETDRFNNEGDTYVGLYVGDEAIPRKSWTKVDLLTVRCIVELFTSDGNLEEIESGQVR